jgi:hypothetical protein
MPDSFPVMMMQDVLGSNAGRDYRGKHHSG